MQFQNDYLEAAHKHSIFHKNEISQSDLCGCFYCGGIFKPTEIIEWVDEDNPKGQTALCPICGIDAVIGDKSAFPITDKNFLNEMHFLYF